MLRGLGRDYFLATVTFAASQIVFDTTSDASSPFSAVCTLKHAPGMFLNRGRAVPFSSSSRACLEIALKCPLRVLDVNTTTWSVAAKLSPSAVTLIVQLPVEFSEAQPPAKCADNAVISARAALTPVNATTANKILNTCFMSNSPYDYTLLLQVQIVFDCASVRSG